MKHYFYLNLALLTISLHGMDNNKKRKLDEIIIEESDAKRVKPTDQKIDIKYCSWADAEKKFEKSSLDDVVTDLMVETSKDNKINLSNALIEAININKKSKRYTLQQQKYIIDELLKKGAQITNTTVLKAIETENVEIVEYLFSKNNKKLTDTENLLKKAIIELQIPVVKSLLNQNVDISIDHFELAEKIYSDRRSDYSWFGNEYGNELLLAEKAYTIGYLLLKAGAPYQESNNYYLDIVQHYKKLKINVIRNLITTYKNDPDLKSKFTSKLDDKLEKFNWLVLELARKRNYSILEKVVQESMKNEYGIYC